MTPSRGATSRQPGSRRAWARGPRLAGIALVVAAASAAGTGTALAAPVPAAPVQAGPVPSASVTAKAKPDRTPPTRPGPLSVQSVAQTRAVVQFGRSRDRSGPVTYAVTANGRTVARATHVSNVSIPLTCGRVYVVAAVAVDRRGNRSAPSPSARLRTRACLDTTPPTQPAGGVLATSVADDHVTLSWGPSSDPGRGTVSSFLVYRDGVVLGGSSTRTFQAVRLRPSQRYTFAVRARDQVGNLSAPALATVTTTPPAQSTGQVSAYVLTTDGNSFADARSHYTSLRRVFPTYFDLTSQGYVTGTDQPTVTSWFQDRGVQVLPRFHDEDPASIESVVTDPVLRTRAAQSIIGAVRSRGYDGANLDLEMNMPSTGIGALSVQQRWEALRNGYSSLVEQVSQGLHADGKLLSVAVSPNWCSTVDRMSRGPVYCSSSASSSTRRPRAYLFDYTRIAASADEVWVMAWGLHWASSEPGAVADVRWLDAVGDYVDDLFRSTPETRSRFTLGTNLYGMDWAYQVARTDRVSMPGILPSAPSCAFGGRAARPRYSYDGTADTGTLTIDWTCLTRFADTHEYSEIAAQRGDFDSTRFDDATGETVWWGTEPGDPGVLREIWFPTTESMRARAAVAAEHGWKTGLWRLGAEDQGIWSLPALSAGPS